MELNSESMSTEIMVNVACTPRNRANLRRLKTTSIQSFQRWEKENELLYAMIEDESSWLLNLFPDQFITADLFFYAMEDGTLLCLLANYIQEMAEKYRQKTGRPVPGQKFPFNKAKRGSRESKLFKSRDNVEKFLSWCRLHGIPEAILFESNDVVLVDECRTGGREIVICLMEIARRCSLYELQELPQLIQLEHEIDQEESMSQADFSETQTIDTTTQNFSGDRSPIDSDSGVESVFEEGAEQTTPRLMEFSLEDDPLRDSSVVNTNKCKEQKHAKELKKEPRSLLETGPKTELDEKVCKIAKDYNIKLVHRLKEGKYIILKKTMFVRMLNDHLLVRIGGGWDTLEHYIMTHTPKPTTGDISTPSSTPPSEPRSRKGSGVWSKLVEKVKRRDSSPNLTGAPVVISKKPRPDSTPVSYKLRDRFKKRQLSVGEKDGKDISEAIQKIESSIIHTPNPATSPSYKTKTFFQLKNRFNRSRTNSRESLTEKKSQAMEDINSGVNDSIKEQAGEENPQNETNDLLNVANEEKTSTDTSTLIDFQDSLAATNDDNSTQISGVSEPATDDLLFGDNQSNEHTTVETTFSSSTVTTVESQLISLGDPLQPEHSEFQRQSEVDMYSQQKEESSFEKVSMEAESVESESQQFNPFLSDEQPTPNIEPTPLVTEPASEDTEDHQSLMQTESQPEDEPPVLDTPMDNVADEFEQTSAEHVETGPPESIVMEDNVHQPTSQDVPEVQLEPQPEETPEVVADNSESAVIAAEESVVHTEPQSDESPPDSAVIADDEHHTSEDVPQPSVSEERSEEVVIDSVESAPFRFEPEQDLPAEAEQQLPTEPEQQLPAEPEPEQPAEPAEPEQDLPAEPEPELQTEPEQQLPAEPEPEQPAELITDSVERVPETEHLEIETPAPAPEDVQPSEPELIVKELEMSESAPTQEMLSFETPAAELSPEVPPPQEQPPVIPPPEEQPQQEQLPVEQPPEIVPVAVQPVEEQPPQETPEKHPDVAPVVVTETKPSAPKTDKGGAPSKSAKAPQSSVPKSKIPAKSTSAGAARPSSAKPSQAKPTQTQSSAATKKPASTRPQQLGATKSATSKPQGAATSPTKPHSAAKRPASTTAKTTTTTKTGTTKPANGSRTTTTTTRTNGTASKPAAKTGTAGSKPGIPSTRSTATSSKPGTAGTKPATTSSKPGTASSKPGTASTKTTRPASSTTRPAATKKTTRPPSAANTEGKARPTSARPTAAKTTDKTDGKAAPARVNGRTTTSARTTTKQTTVTKSAHDPISKTTTKTTSKTTVRDNKTPLNGKAKPGSATSAKAKTTGTARPKSPTKVSTKKTTAPKDEKPPVEPTAEPVKIDQPNITTDVTTTEGDGIVTEVSKMTHTEVNEDGSVVTVSEVSETIVTTNGEQQLISTETTVEESG